jgi:hypothetical protein
VLPIKARSDIAQTLDNEVVVRPAVHMRLENANAIGEELAQNAPSVVVKATLSFLRVLNLRRKGDRQKAAVIEALGLHEVLDIGS